MQPFYIFIRSFDYPYVGFLVVAAAAYLFIKYPSHRISIVISAMVLIFVLGLATIFFVESKASKERRALTETFAVKTEEDALRIALKIPQIKACIDEKRGTHNEYDPYYQEKMSSEMRSLIPADQNGDPVLWVTQIESMGGGNPHEYYYEAWCGSKTANDPTINYYINRETGKVSRKED